MKKKSSNEEKKFEYLYLAGGLSESKYFQSRIKEKFGPSSNYHLQIVIPKRPILSVVDGSARYGLIKHYVVQRRLRKTYGIAIEGYVSYAKNLGASDEYIKNNSYVDKNSNVTIVTDLFYPLKTKGDPARVEEDAVKHKFEKVGDYAFVEVFEADDKNPCVIKNCRSMGNFVYGFPEECNDSSCIVEIEFYETTIKVFACPESQPDLKQQLSVNYEFDGKFIWEKK